MASVLLKACKQSDDPSDMEVILGGLASLNDELSWFKKEAFKWGVHLTAALQKANSEYCRYLSYVRRIRNSNLEKNELVLPYKD